LALPEANASMSNEAYALQFTTMVVVDYETFFPREFSKCNLVCHCGKQLIRGGWSTYTRMERGFGIGRIFQPLEYRCMDCAQPKDDRKTSCFNSLSPEIIKQLSVSLRQKLNFIVGPSHLVSRETMVLIGSLVTNGSSIGAIESSARTAVQTELGYRERERLNEVERQIAIAVMNPRRITAAVSVVELVDVFALSSYIIEAVFLAEFERREPLIQASFLHASIGQKVIQNDACFPWGNQCSPTGMIALHHIFNMNGEAIGRRYTPEAYRIHATRYTV
jgi:hypothetical protein